ncbi:MAG: VWA domain-containing protein [Candidatus Krumholzibacteria bacterium]|nr:VWA domain-containing protein [Candidatus Krumholzibacteria bacterium]
MRFAEDIWLWFVPLLPLAWLMYRAGDRSAARRLVQLLGDQAASHLEAANPRLRSWQRFFLLAGMFWLLLGLARPQWGASEVTVTQQGSDIGVALDISNSMLAEDVVPNRMERAKAELGSFLNRLEDSRVGLVFFAGASFVQCPLTLDYGTADIFLKMAGPDMMSEQGTAIGAALKSSRELLAKGAEGSPEGGFQAILLVTDGEDLEGDWEAEARACQEQGIRVIPVGVGEEGGGLIPLLDSQGRPAGFMKDDEGNVVMTRMDLAKLEDLAAIGGGSTFRLGIDGLAGDRLFAELERLGRRDLEDRRISAYQERYMWPLVLALLSFALRLVLRPRRPAPAQTVGAGLRRSAVVALVLLGGWAGLGSSATAGITPPELGEMKTGLARYEAGQYEEALVAFELALVRAPDNPAIGLAVGEALFQLERYEEAANEFQRVLDLTTDPDLRAEALYNKGTAQLAAGQPAEAVDHLRQSLQVDPGQKDALFNLEVALQRLKQQQQQEQQEQEEQEKKEQEEQEKQEEQEQEQEEPQDQQQQEQEQQDQEKQDQEQEQEQEDQQEQQGDEPKEQEQEPQEEPEAQPELDPEELTKEQQEQILQALDRDEEELKRSVQKRLKGGKPKSGKKW